VSTAYYALFHCLARDRADLMIGGTGANRSRPAWAQVYRALEHGLARTQCENRDVVAKFPKPIENLAICFVMIQKKRHLADYDPLARFSKSGVQADIKVAERAILSFQAEAPADRRAFCAWVLFRAPRK